MAELLFEVWNTKHDRTVTKREFDSSVKLWSVGGEMVDFGFITSCRPDIEIRQRTKKKEEGNARLK